MQANEVKAFRQRLIRAGFDDISIYDNGNGTYTLYCTAPNGVRIIERSLTVLQMNNIPHLVYFPKYGF